VSLIGRFVFALVLLVGPLPAVAEPPRLAPGQRLEGRFTQERILKGLMAPLRSEGRFVLVPTKGVVWRTETPFQTTTVITQAGIMQILPGSAPTRLSAARAPFIAHFYDMLGGALVGDWSALERGFAVKRQETGAGWRVELAPSEPTVAAQIQAITLIGAGFVNEIEVAKPGGDRERLVFSEQRAVGGPVSAEDERLFDLAAK
jgi:hypothetical protein